MASKTMAYTRSLGRRFGSNFSKCRQIRRQTEINLRRYEFKYIRRSFAGRRESPDEEDPENEGTPTSNRYIKSHVNCLSDQARDDGEDLDCVSGERSLSQYQRRIKEQEERR